MRLHQTQKGYILLPIVIIITMISIVALMMNMESAMGTGASSSEQESDQARYVAEAGLNHALWQVEQAGCGPYTDIVGKTFGDHGYDAAITPNQAGGVITTITVPVTDDAWVNESASSQNYGNDAQLQVLGQWFAYRLALYRFDIENAGIPAGATVVSAACKLFVIDSDVSAIDIFRVEADWDETTVTYSNVVNHYDWFSPVSQLPANNPVGAYAEGNLTALVQGWVNGSVANQGILLDSAGYGDVSQYTSKEYGNLDQRPYLEVKIIDGSLSTRADISATGMLANGMEQTLTRNAVVLYQPPSSLTWQLGPELEDAFIRDGASDDKNFGISPILNLKDDRNVLIRFPLEALPPGSRVIDADLDLYLADGGGVNDGLLDLHRVSRSWVEGTFDDENPPTGGGVTYTEYDGGNLWDNEGGDYGAAIIDQVILPSMVPGWYTWNVTTQVQAWLNGQANYGFLLREGGGDAGDIDFVSSDDTTTPEYRPRLNITLACECGQACMIPRGSGSILVVVGNPWNLDPGELALLKLFEAWGYTYTLIQDDDSQGNFDAAATTHDVAFISTSAGSSNVGTKLTDTNIGVVSAKRLHFDELGISTDSVNTVGQTIIVTDTSHEITQIFPAGSLQFIQHDMKMSTATGTLAPGAQILAEAGGNATLVVLDQGAALAGGGNAAGRRVALPVKVQDFDLYLTNNGQLLIQRAIEWAKPLSCGDGDYADDFDTAAFNNNDGSFLWGGDWLEVDGAGAGAGSGNVRITGGLLEMDDNPDTGGQPSVTRTFNLLSATGALLDLDFELDNRTDQGSDVALLEISTDGTNWDVLQDFSIYSGNDSGHRQYDLSAYLVTDVQIRLRIESGYGGSEEAIWIDNLVVSVCGTLDQPPSTGPIAHWPLDEPSGPTAQDVEGGHDGDLIDGPVWAPGLVDGGLSFDGVDDYVNVPHQDTLSFSSFTISAWVRPAALNGWRIVMSKGTSADLNYYLGTHDDEISMGFLNVGVWTEFETTNANLETGNWYHLAGTFDDTIGEAKIYLNGARLHTATTGASPPACTDDLMIGTTVFDEFWSGLLDDVRIYNRVLGDGEVADIYAEVSPLDFGAEYVDQFNDGDYDGSDGTLDWSPLAWTEINDDGAPDTGYVRVWSGKLHIRNTNGGAFEGILRSADLSIGSPTSAILSFDVGGNGLGSDDGISVMVSENGGSTWVELEKIRITDGMSDTRSYNLQDYIALTSDFQLKIAIIAGMTLAGEEVTLDNVLIDLDSGGGGGGGCDGNYADGFNARTFSGDDGSLSWTIDWREVGESDGPTSGDIGVGNDQSNYQLRLRDNDNGGEGVTRQVDLSRAGSATLSFTYRRQGLDRASDYVVVQIRSGASDSWDEIGRIAGPATDGAYQPHSIDISGYASATTQIGFITSPTMGGLDVVWIDDVDITCSP